MALINLSIFRDDPSLEWWLIIELHRKSKPESNKALLEAKQRPSQVDCKPKKLQKRSLKICRFRIFIFEFWIFSGFFFEIVENYSLPARIIS